MRASAFLRRAPLAAALAALALAAGCATGAPLTTESLDREGWGKAADYLCHVSTALALTVVPGDYSALDPGFEERRRLSRAGSTIAIPPKTAGFIARVDRKNGYVWASFDGFEAPFANYTPPDGGGAGQFYLVTTVDETGAECVESGGVRYAASWSGKGRPHLRVVEDPSPRRQAPAGIATALKSAGARLMADLPESAVIAVAGVRSRDSGAAALARDALEADLAGAKRWTLVDRTRLSEALAERDFQTSGNVGDESSVRLGHLLGASVVVTGEIAEPDSSGSSHRLTLKALEVETGVILSHQVERFGGGF